MTSEHRRRAIEASMLEISEAHRDLILKMDAGPERTFRELEERGYRIPRRKACIKPTDYD